MKILNFTSANVDYVYSVSHIVRPGETISAPKMEIFPGGKGLNQSVAVARAGGNIYHAGFVGTDGGLLEDILADSGAKLDFLCRADSKNGHAIIQVNEQAENCIVIYQGTNGMFSKEYIDNVLGAFVAGDFAMVQNEVNNLPYIIEKAYEKGLQIVFNPSPFDDSLKNLELKHYFMEKNPLADYLARNAIEEAETYAKGTAWSRIIWDVTAVAWLLNDDDRFMLSRIIPGKMPDYDNQYESVSQEYPIRYVDHIKRDKLLNALIHALT